MTVQRGRPPTNEESFWLRAAALLEPEKTIARIDAKVAFVFANLALIGTILAGVGIFTDLGARLRNEAHVVIRRTGNNEILYWTENYATYAAAVAAGQILLTNGLVADFFNETGEQH